MKENKQVRTVCSVFIKKDGKFLLVYDPFFRAWRVPGGKLEKHESVEDCAIREIKEELKIKIKNPEFIGFGQDDHVAYFKKLDYKKRCPRLILYFMTETKDKITPDPVEISKFKWLTLSEIKKHSNKEGALEDLFKRNINLRF